MNNLFISGKVVEQPALRLEGGDAPHLTFTLRVAHRTRAGERRAEDYRVNAWNRIAQWGVENLARGQLVAVHGYLTQSASRGNAVEITATEFMPMEIPKASAAPEEAPEFAAPVREAAEAAAS